ncbi:MAG TPA: hypothetical protein VJB11_02905 [archaeon]|nr:hypothetical protein [archaeon]
MSVIGLQLKSVKASIDEKKIIEGNINVNSSPRIESVEKKDINVPGIKDVLSINFIFEVNYDPKVGEIEMEGEVLYQTDKSKDILAKWKKDRKLEDDMAVEVLNAIFRRCLVEALSLSNELRLPPPIRLPIVQKAAEEDKKS